MFEVVLYQPEIPPNTGNAMRLCAVTGCRLHLIEPLGFELSDTKLKRAGMDYRDKAVTSIHASLEEWREGAGESRVFALTVDGENRYTDPVFEPGDSFLFGPESVGLPAEIKEADWIEARLRLPMVAGVRSLNLSNAISIVVYEAWRQHDFAGGSTVT